MKKTILLALTLLSFNALADQCQYVTAESAQTAVKLISLSKKNAGGVLDLCQNCGDRSPKEIRVNQIDIGNTEVTEVPAEVSINGRGIDLAYTYVNVGNGIWINLGKLSNCANTGTSQYITEKKTESGVRYIVGPIL